MFTKAVYPICQILAHTWTDMTTQGISENFINVKKIPMVFDETSRNCVFGINLNNNYNPPIMYIICSTPINQ